MLGYKKFLFAWLVFVFVLMPSTVQADDTCCVGHGGNYSCNVGTSQLYCADGTVSTQCSCHAAPTPTPTAVPTDTPAISQAPTCPANAVFSTSSNACTCNSGYVVSSNACVTYLQYCQSQYGGNSSYNSGSNSCACANGYTWNTSGSSCVTMDQLCSEKIGSKSYYNSSDNQCYCYQGYAIANNQCQLIPTPIPPDTPVPTKGVPIGPVKPVVIPTLASVVVPTSAPTKPPVKKSITKFNFSKKVPGLNGFVAVKKKSNGFFGDLLSNIWDVIKKALNL